MSHIPQVDISWFFSVQQHTRIEFSWQDLTRSRKDGKGSQWSTKNVDNSPAVTPQMCSAASVVCPKHISGEGVDVELGKVVLGAERSQRVLTHTPSLSSAPAPFCCHTPKGKGLHSPAASASASTHLGSAEHTGTLPLKCWVNSCPSWENSCQCWVSCSGLNSPPSSLGRSSNSFITGKGRGLIANNCGATCLQDIFLLLLLLLLPPVWLCPVFGSAAVSSTSPRFCDVSLPHFTGGSLQILPVPAEFIAITFMWKFPSPPAALQQHLWILPETSSKITQEAQCVARAWTILWDITADKITTS